MQAPDDATTEKRMRRQFSAKRFRRISEPLGERFFFDNRSIHGKFFGAAARMSDEQVKAMAAITEKMAYSFDRQPQPEQVLGASGGVLRTSDFVPVNGGPFFKFVPERYVRPALDGSFRFGTAKYYRQIENLQARDPREGFSQFILRGEVDVVGSMMTGNNAAILCGTSSLEQTAEMSARFGGKKITIAPLDEFAKVLRRVSGAMRVHVYDVVYADQPVFMVDFPRAGEVLRQSKGPNGICNIKWVTENMFHDFYYASFLPGLITKPTSYAIERERRIVLEMREDVNSDFVHISDRALSKFVTCLDG